MKKSELKKISLKYRTLSSQMLKVDSQEEINYIKMYYDFINNTEIIAEYIKSCHKQDYDFDEIDAAFNAAAEFKGKPSVIVANSVKGKGVSFMEDQVSWHGSAPNAEQYEQAMSELSQALIELEA